LNFRITPNGTEWLPLVENALQIRANNKKKEEQKIEREKNTTTKE
jgi:hypothetical protein